MRGENQRPHQEGNVPNSGQFLLFFLGCHHHSNRANQVLCCMLAGSVPPVPEGMNGCHCCPSHKHDDDLQIPW